MKISRAGSTIKQTAYARRAWNGDGRNKKQIALDVGYSIYSASSVKTKIENKKGFQNAMAALALESNNVALSILHEFKSRGVSEFSNKDLVGALNAIGSAWSKFNQPKDMKVKPEQNNKLRTVILQKVENQTITPAAIEPLPPVEDIEDVENIVDEEKVVDKEGDNPNDF